MTDVISNPILPGFNPDPSICRVGDDYYIATSTFEWYPGVQIHHSRDLKNWRLVARPLNRPDLLDMTGEPDSCGVWAPCLTYNEGLFYLVYTDVKRFDGNYKDTHNYVTTCATIDGDWSSPVYMNSSGFDPSLFHDDDGRKWYVNMVWDHRRPGPTFFKGIDLQEYCPEQKKLMGPVHSIFPGSDLSFTEGPHLYKRNGYYYLITAEGGTGYNHAVTMARSKSLTGPYELHPIKHIITAKDTPDNKIQRAGHGDFVETQSGEVYHVHLCSRPLSLWGGKAARSPMGRETAIQKMEWREDDWLWPIDGDCIPKAEIAIADLPPEMPSKAYARHDFDETALPDEFQWLRVPDPSVFMSLTDRAGFLRLYGRESIGSWYKQALIARRQQAFCFTASTQVEFEPEHFQQMGGLVCYYNTHKFHYLYISRDETLGKVLNVMSCVGDQSWMLTFGLEQGIKLPDNVPVYLRAAVDFDKLQFSWSLDGTDWHLFPVTQDYSLLSDEAGKGEGANFTGAFVGMCCQDVAGTGLHADFDFFEYIEW
ncbi:glycoside hydrolase family 43 protein [Marinibactrum halimedae]|uniref:Glycoside hydrolase 43 family protein n=1 Tax=Marinibactrum halimedae TaxID=1444977 RepID=A0AA37T6R4_9GAMM|nr:glycoside hydrolase family 43 protein [Marinibactrum halimedae]MCD9460341.1 glycoside hydrolase family 43 protein [Marinibactrum halimedae]GLS26776.1 glycoside hydrolase 43 family protein [Marinibactrum halimedae]